MGKAPPSRPQPSTLSRRNGLIEPVTPCLCGLSAVRRGGCRSDILLVCGPYRTFTAHCRPSKWVGPDFAATNVAKRRKFICYYAVRTNVNLNLGADDEWNALVST